MSLFSRGVKASALPEAGKASTVCPLLTFWSYCYYSLPDHSAPAILTPLLLLTYALTQGLCTCSFPCLESGSSRYPPGSFPYSSRSLLKYHLLKEAFSAEPILNFTSTSHTHHPALYGPLLLFFVLGTYHHPTLLSLLMIHLVFITEGFYWQPPGE